MARIATRAQDSDGQEERRTRILDCAERCFVRSGFHRTTMQDIAAEAGMSPGNLYRYFQSKDAVVVGMAERDRAELGRDFGELAEASDLPAAFRAMARKHFVEEAPEKSVLCLEIWAESSRNPRFAEVSAQFEREVVGRLGSLIRGAQERGHVARDLDPDAIAITIVTFANGLFVRRAIAPGFDAEREVEIFNALVAAAFAGRIDLRASDRDRSSDSMPTRETV